MNINYPFLFTPKHGLETPTNYDIVALLFNFLILCLWKKYDKVNAVCIWFWFIVLNYVDVRIYGCFNYLFFIFIVWEIYKCNAFNFHLLR